MPSERLAHKKLTELALNSQGKIRPEKRGTGSVSPPDTSNQCQAYYDMTDSMRRLLCERCDKYGNVKTEFGVGRCRRYSTGKEE